uniref:Uncharacterized protein n=1 Tax=Peronospora matthiolae TaxID=2874970 RepID=A0AAV1V115_9STRA
MLSSGAYIEPPRREWRPDELPRPLGCHPPAWDSWEPRAQLIVNDLGLVKQYDETHPLRSKKGRRNTTYPNVSTEIARCQSLRPSQ